jgi:hypothetical protein
MQKLFRNSNAATSFYSALIAVHMSTSLYKRPEVTSTITTSS